jgi:CDGSH iron-sulfur domain-containing protein 3
MVRMGHRLKLFPALAARQFGPLESGSSHPAVKQIPSELTGRPLGWASRFSCAGRANWLSKIRRGRRVRLSQRTAKMAEPERPQLNPYQVELEAGRRYSWCRCGRSKKQPFCDGSHAGTGIEPLTFTAERTELALLCGCKDTGDPPYCDGSHLLL